MRSRWQLGVAQVLECSCNCRDVFSERQRGAFMPQEPRWPLARAGSTKRKLIAQGMRTAARELLCVAY